MSDETNEGLLQRSQSLVPLGSGILELAHVQALPVLSLGRMQAGLFTAASLLVGQATRITLLFRSETIPTTSKENVNQTANHGRLPHVLHACFILDGIILARLGLPFHLRTLQGANIQEVPEDGMEEWNSVRGFLKPSSHHPGPLLALSTFNSLGIAMQDFLAAFLGSESLYAENGQPEVLELHTGNSMERKPASFHSSSVKLPHQSTLQLLRYGAVVIRTSNLHQDEAYESGKWKQTRSSIQVFCQLSAEKLSLFEPRAITSIWEPIWAIMSDNLEAHKSRYPDFINPTLEAMYRTFSLMDGSPALRSLAAQNNVPLSTQPLNRVLDPVPPVTIPTLNGAACHGAVSNRDSAVATQILDPLAWPMPLSQAGAAKNSSSGKDASTNTGIGFGAADTANTDYASGVSDAGSTVFDFMTLDAIGWYVCSPRYDGSLRETTTD